MLCIGYCEAKAGEGLVAIVSQPLTRLNLATLDFATLSHKGRGEESAGSYSHARCPGALR